MGSLALTLVALAAGLLAAVAASSSSGPGSRSDDGLRDASPVGTTRVPVRHGRPAATGASPGPAAPASAAHATMRPPAIPALLVTMPVALTAVRPARCYTAAGCPLAAAAVAGSDIA